MNFVQLEGFVVLAEELHFGRAAHRLSASTPNVSKRIADLERGLGIRLFERTSRHVRLTPAGALLLDPAKRALSDLQLLQVMASNAARGRAGVVSIAYSPGTGQTVAKPARKLRTSSEFRVDVTLEQLTSVRVVEEVGSGRAMIGVCRGSGPGLSRLVVSRSLLNLVAMPADHSLGAMSTVATTDLEGETFLQPDASLTTLTATREVFHLPGIHINIRFERAQTETEVMDRVAAGFGLSLISAAFYERNRRPDVVARPVRGVENQYDEHDLIWRVDDDSVLVAFVVDEARSLVP